MLPLLAIPFSIFLGIRCVVLIVLLADSAAAVHANRGRSDSECRDRALGSHWCCSTADYIFVSEKLLSSHW